LIIKPKAGSRGILSTYLRKKRIEIALKFVKGTKLLDVGCNEQFLKSFLDNKIDYTGIDMHTPEYIRPQFKYFQTDIEDNLDFLEKYDCATMLAVIEHLKKPGKALQNIHSVLNPGGRLIITTPTKKGDKFHKGFSKIKFTSSAAVESHEKIYTQKELREILENNGFKVIHSSKFFMNLNQVIIGESV